LSAKPPRSRTGWPEFGWMAGQTVKGQLLTRVKINPGYVAVERVHRTRSVTVKKRAEAIFVSVGEGFAWGFIGLEGA